MGCPAVSERTIVPPHSAEAEQSVIGGLLLDNAALIDISDLEARHFYHSEHQLAFRVIRSMCMDGKVADVLTASDAGAGSIAYLNEMAQSVPSARNVARYAEIVRARWLERELIRAAGESIDDAVGMGDATAKLDRAQARLAGLAIVKSVQASVRIDEALIEFLARLDAEASGKSDAISTGLRDLDDLMDGGLRKGELMVLGARPKMGKTATVLGVARHMAITHAVLFLSQEMPVSQLTARNVAAEGGVNIAKLRRPDLLTNDDWSRISEATEQLRSRRLIMDDQRGLTLMDVRRKVMECKRNHGCDVVIVDFLQLMQGDGDSRNQELDRISNGLKAMAGELDVAVILLSQMSRKADERHGPPVMTDLRDSGAIEAAADIIALLYREFAHPLGEKSDGWKHHAQLELVQRNAAPGSVNLWFSGEHQQVRNWSGPPPSKTGSRGARARSSGVE
jgi:replicative DNA helicase